MFWGGILVMFNLASRFYSEIRMDYKHASCIHFLWLVNVCEWTPCFDQQPIGKLSTLMLAHLFGTKSGVFCLGNENKKTLAEKPLNIFVIGSIWFQNSSAFPRQCTKLHLHSYIEPLRIDCVCLDNFLVLELLLRKFLSSSSV